MADLDLLAQSGGGSRYQLSPTVPDAGSVTVSNRLQARYNNMEGSQKMSPFFGLFFSRLFPCLLFFFSGFPLIVLND